MEVHQAKAFLAVAEQLHFGRAAQQLKMAQPPLSRLIKQVERSLGTQLFDRSTRHVELTAAGRALLKPAQDLVFASENARNVVLGAISGELGRVKIGFAGASTNQIVGQLARKLRKTHSGLKLEFHSSQFSHLGLEHVLDGSLDIAIGRWDFLPAEIESRVMALEEILLVLPVSHRLAQRASVDMTELSAEEWVVLPGGFGNALQNRMNSMAMAAGFVPRIVQTAPDSWTLTVLVGAEIGCAVTVDSVKDSTSSQGVSFVRLRGANTRLEVRMIWRQDDSSPAVRTVTDVADRIFQDPRSQDS